MLYIDPDTCIDCGACVDECPVEAIFPDNELDEDDAPYLQMKRVVLREASDGPGLARADHDGQDRSRNWETLKVAIVGSGPGPPATRRWN